jgi:hypothetical protein
MESSGVVAEVPGLNLGQATNYLSVSLSKTLNPTCCGGSAVQKVLQTSQFWRKKTVYYRTLNFQPITDTVSCELVVWRRVYTGPNYYCCLGMHEASVPIMPSLALESCDNYFVNNETILQYNNAWACSLLPVLIFKLGNPCGQRKMSRVKGVNHLTIHRVYLPNLSLCQWWRGPAWTS